jgi:hypothetical protein
MAVGSEPDRPPAWFSRRSSSPFSGDDHENVFSRSASAAGAVRPTAAKYFDPSQ